MDRIMSRFVDVPTVDDVVVGRLLLLRDQVARPGEDVLGELMGLFERDTRARIQALQQAVAAGDDAEKKSAAHALKGSAGNVGAARVAAWAAWLEKNAAAPADVKELEIEVEAALVALRQRLR